MPKITKAVIAVAGYGTRFIPATKVQPKELLPIVDKPVIQYLVEEAVQAGITDVILVTRPGTRAIEDHFDSSRDLEVHLEEQGKDKYLEMVQNIPKLANFAFVPQARHLPYGNGTPILAAKNFIGHEPFVYMFGDDVVMADTPCTQQLIDTFRKYEPGAVIAAQAVPDEETVRYGIARLKPGTDRNELESIVEKPPLGTAPSNLAQLGRFVLSPQVIDILENLELGQGNELWLTDAIDRLTEKAPVIVHEIEGTWYTTGDPLRFLKTTVEFALRHPDIGRDFAGYLRGLDLSGF
ncbi:MAG: UTP--glucose-1-phosphate uridylyltransferase [Anaerolineae bacterium]